MKNLYIGFYLCCLLLLSSCYPENQPDEIPEEVSLEDLREETGGTPSEVTTQGTGIFFAYNQNCTAGFGWCDVNLAQPNPTAPDKVEPDTKRFKRYKATFYLGTQKDTTVLRIEFSEKIPHFGPVFNVGYSDTLENSFGYQYVVPQIGNYPTIEPSEMLQYGGVEIPVSKGSKIDVYPKEEKN